MPAPLFCPIWLQTNETSKNQNHISVSHEKIPHLRLFLPRRHTANNSYTGTGNEKITFACCQDILCLAWWLRIPLIFPRLQKDEKANHDHPLLIFSLNLRPLIKNYLW